MQTTEPPNTTLKKSSQIELKLLMHATSIKSCTVLPPSNTQTGGKEQITFITKQSNQIEAGEEYYMSKILRILV